MPVVDQIAFAMRLGKLRLHKKQRSRSVERSLLVHLLKPRPPLIWGGDRVYYHYWWAVCIFAAILLPGIALMWLRPHGRPLPGGTLNLLTPLVIVIGGPIFVFIARTRQLAGREAMDTTTFEEGVHKLFPDVPGKFALAVRHALGAAYCVPVELIGYADKRGECKALSLSSEPLAVEIIAEVCLSQDVEFDLDRLRSAAEPFRSHRPVNVAEVIQLLHREMRSWQLQ